jgi:hypothetical protein
LPSVYRFFEDSYPAWPATALATTITAIAILMITFITIIMRVITLTCILTLAIATAIYRPALTAPR